MLLLTIFISILSMHIYFYLLLSHYKIYKTYNYLMVKNLNMMKTASLCCPRSSRNGWWCLVMGFGSPFDSYTYYNTIKQKLTTFCIEQLFN